MMEETKINFKKISDLKPKYLLKKKTKPFIRQVTLLIAWDIDPIIENNFKKLQNILKKKKMIKKKSIEISKADNIWNEREVYVTTSRFGKTYEELHTKISHNELLFFLINLI